MPNFWENDKVISPSQQQPWAADSVISAPAESGISSAARFAGTAIARGLGGAVDMIGDPLHPLRKLISPEFERIEQSLRSHPGQAAADLAFSTTGMPEYQPETALGRVGMAGAQGAVGGSPFGPAGAVIGALSGVAGQGTQELTGNERAATAAGLAPALGAAGIAAARGARRPIPTAGELKNAAVSGYKTAQNSGVEYAGDAISNMAGDIRVRLDAEGLFDVLAPKTHTLLDRASNPPSGAVSTVANLRTLKRVLGRVARETSEGKATEDAVAASMAIRGLDSFMERPDAASLAAGSPGDAATVADLIRTANRNYGAAQRSNSLTGTLDRATTGVLERAENRAQAANSGRNLDNSIRQRIASLLEKPRSLHGFTAEEIAALDAVLQGGPARNSSRYIGNLLGGGGGLGQIVTGAAGGAGGYAAGGWPGFVAGTAAPAVIGAGAKSLSNALARRSLGLADETIRMNSPLYEMGPMPSPDAAVLRALLPGLLGIQPSPDQQTQSRNLGLSRR